MPDYYGNNMLTNGNAELGNTSSWTATNASAVSGGSGSYCFQIDSGGGSMLQNAVPSAQYNEYEITGKFLPEYELGKTSVIFGKIQTKMNYSDSTIDYNEVPCVEDLE